MTRSLMDNGISNKANLRKKLEFYLNSGLTKTNGTSMINTVITLKTYLNFKLELFRSILKVVISTMITYLVN